MKSICYRTFSGYGEDQDDAYPFPSICKRVLAECGAEILNVWGTGAQMHDFIHIEDCMYGVMTTIDKIDDGSAIPLDRVFTSFIDFAKLAAGIVGYHPQVKGLSDKPAGVYTQGGDTTKPPQESNSCEEHNR